MNGNTFTTPDGEEYVPLYEGKMIWHYNHHYGTWPTEGERPNSINMPSLDELSNPNSHIMPWYWVPLTAVMIDWLRWTKTEKLFGNGSINGSLRFVTLHVVLTCEHSLSRLFPTPAALGIQPRSSTRSVAVCPGLRFTA